jgi:hypothetical protein
MSGGHKHALIDCPLPEVFFGGARGGGKFRMPHGGQVAFSYLDTVADAEGYAGQEPDRRMG